MPELPEVETTRRSLESRVIGALIRSVRLGKPLRWPLGCVPESLCGRTIRGLHRRAKYLCFELDEGLLLVHLGMSGSLRWVAHDQPAGPHDHFDLDLPEGVVRLHDPRRFGAVVWLAGPGDPQYERLLGAWGVEPLSEAFTPDHLYAGLRGTRTSIKQALLGGRIVVGVGNIYACEALFEAGIRPTTRADRIGKARVLRLHAAIRGVLGRALEAGGSSLRDYAHTDGSQGHFQTQTQVYGRAGQPCHACATPIALLRQGQRSTYHCPACQR